ncbi:MAG: DMT family transporter, partial [Janthinobacterium lividum]
PLRRCMGHARRRDRRARGRGRRAAVIAPRRLTPRTAIEFALVTLIWGSTWLVIKGQIGVVPVSWSVAYRFFLAGGLMLVLCIVGGRWQSLGRAGHLFASIAGAMQFTFNFNLVYASELTLTSGLVSLVFALLVVPNALLARVFLGTPITPRFAFGAALGVAGLSLVFLRDLGQPHGNVVGGLLLAGGAVLCASTANVMQASRLARSLPALPTLALTMLYGAAMAAIYAFAVAGPPVFDPRPAYLLGLAYLAVVASIVAFTLYYSLIRSIGPARAAYSSVIVPVVAMSLSTLFENYVWTPAAIGGSVLAAIGLVIALRSRG